MLELARGFQFCSPCSSGFVAGAIAASAACAGSAQAQCEIANLVGSDVGPNARLGVDVAIDGESVLVGEDHDEIVYAFDRQAGKLEEWVETGSLIVTDGSDTGGFGASISIDGDIAAVGAYLADIPGQFNAGAVWIFERSPDPQWAPMRKLTSPDPGFFSAYGIVALDGDTLLVGSPLDEIDGERIGSVYVYRRSHGGPDNWGLVQRLNAADSGVDDQFGFSVELDGPTAVIGALYDDGQVDDEGSAYVFELDGDGAFQQTAKLKAGDAAGLDLFGIALAVAEEIIVVGANKKENDAGVEEGAAYVFERESGAWSETAKLVASDAGENDWFGAAVAITEHELVLVGAPKPGPVNETEPGTVYVFARDGKTPGGWSELERLTSPNASGSSAFGVSIAVDGDLLVVGASGDLTPIFSSGSAFLFDLGRCLCAADLDGSAGVGFPDLLDLLFAWGRCADCPADLDGNGEIDSQDLQELLSSWGPCP